MTPTDPGTFVSGPSERTTLSMPIFINNKIVVKKDKNEEYEKRHGNCAWVLPIQGKNGNIEQPKKIELILERFGCLSSCSKKLSEEIFTAKKTKVLEDFADAETGPRTIAQVRRENKKQELIQGGDLGSGHGQMDGQGSGIGGGGGGGGEDEIFDNVDMNEGTGTMSATASSGNISDEKYDRKKDGFSLISGSSFLNISSDCVGIPINALDLADVESKRDSVTVMVLWSCRLGGQIVRGVSAQVSHSILPESTRQGSVREREKEKERPEFFKEKVSRGPCDYISLGISHPSSISISKQNKRADVTVTLEIQSNSKKNLIASLEILDKKSKTSSTELSPSSTVSIEKKQKFQPQRGLRWEKKTHFTDIQLFPHESKSFQFHAVISNSGVFDLNRLVRVSECAFFFPEVSRSAVVRYSIDIFRTSVALISVCYLYEGRRGVNRRGDEILDHCHYQYHNHYALQYFIQSYYVFHFYHTFLHFIHVVYYLHYLIS